MTDLVVGGVMNILREVRIDPPESVGVFAIAGSSRNLAVLDSTQFVVLGIEVGLEGLSGG